jgi:FixJ family two-component response regulator
MAQLEASPAVIAVVDDDEAVCDAVSSLVRSAGHRCITFGSAEAFLGFGRLGDAACILLDIRMAGMDGLDLQLALNRRECRVPIIYVTANTDPELRERAFRQGAAAFLTKPFDDTDLLNAIERAVNGSDSAGRGTTAGPDGH